MRSPLNELKIATPQSTKKINAKYSATLTPTSVISLPLNSK